MGLCIVVFNVAEWPTQDQVPDTSQFSFFILIGFRMLIVLELGRLSRGAGVAYGAGWVLHPGSQSYH